MGDRTAVQDTHLGAKLPLLAAGRRARTPARGRLHAHGGLCGRAGLACCGRLALEARRRAHEAARGLAGSRVPVVL